MPFSPARIMTFEVWFLTESSKRFCIHVRVPSCHCETGGGIGWRMLLDSGKTVLVPKFALQSSSSSSSSSFSEQRKESNLSVRHQTLLSMGEVFFVIKVQGKPTLLPIGLPHQGYTRRCYHLNGGKSDPLFFGKETSTPRHPEMFTVNWARFREKNNRGNRTLLKPPGVVCFVSRLPSATKPGNEPENDWNVICQVHLTEEAFVIWFTVTSRTPSSFSIWNPALSPASFLWGFILESQNMASKKPKLPKHQRFRRRHNHRLIW